MILGNCYKYGLRGFTRYNPKNLASLRSSVLPNYRITALPLRTLMVNNSQLSTGNLNISRLHPTPMAMLNKRQRTKIALKEHRREKLMRQRGERIENKKGEVEVLFPAPEETLEKIEEEMKTEIDESIDLIIKLGIDPIKSQQQVRGTIVLPAGSGRDRKVAVFTSLDNEELAKESGADMILSLEDISEITGEDLGFETLLATKDVIKLLKPFGRTIGPLGLMPNLKSGTLVDADDLQKTVKVLKAGKIEVRNCHQAYIRAWIGKRRFTREQLMENLEAVIQRLKELKPESVRGKRYIQGWKISRSRGPSHDIDIFPMFKFEEYEL